MDDFRKTLFDLENQATHCSKSDRITTLEFLKKLISNLETVDDKTFDGLNDDEQQLDKCCVTKTESHNDSIHKSPLKLTIRKFKSVESNVVCHECHRTFISMKKMISHVINSHAKAELTCRICKGTFYCHNLFIIHECLCPRQSVFVHRQCGICDKLFLQKKEYYFHMKEEHMLTLDAISKSFACHICKSTFQLRSQLLVHSSQVHKENNSKDDYSARFLKISQNGIRLESDTSSVHSKSKSVIKSRNWCVVCKRNFLSQKALNKHFQSYMHKVNAGELKMFKKFVCDVCGNSFNKMICLQRHVSSHHNEFAHKCNLCDYRTSEKCNLTEHMRRHYQIRNFACEFCDARFIAKRELKDHVAFKHNSLRPFECSDCGKLFKTKRILRRHSKTHSEFRPYACACGSSFLRMTNLRRHHLSVHHEPNPIITKVQVADDGVDSDQLKDYWYADSKYIKNKKTTPLSLSINVEKEERLLAKEKNDPMKVEKLQNGLPINTISTNPSNLQILNVNYIMDLAPDHEKNPKMYWSVNQNFLDHNDIHSTNQSLDTSPLNGIISKDSSVIEDSLNICDLVSSPSYPIQSDDTTLTNKMAFGISLKSENIISKYKVDSLMMETENRNPIDGIWRPIDTIDNDTNMLDDQTSSSMVSNALDIFPSNNAGLISSFNEVFLTSVSNQCYPDDAGQWNGLALSNQNSYNADNNACFYNGTVSACEPLCDNMPVADSTSTVPDNFLYYSHHQQATQHQPQQPNQSFAYIESYSANIDHNYGTVSDNYTGASFCPSALTNNQMQDIFSLSYSSAANSEFVQIPPNNSAIANILFNPDQLFHNNSSSSSSSSSSSNTISTMAINHPLRILSPIDFFVADNVFSSGLKQEYCLSLHDLPNNVDSSLIADYCSQTHPFAHNSAQLCSKNFSVVNLISTGCASANCNKDVDDSDNLLFAGPDESVL